MTETKELEIAHRDLWMAFWKNPEAPDAVARLIDVWMPLVHRILSRMKIRLPQHVQVEDLVQSAVIGLYQAIEKYDASHGAPFETFASLRIRGAVLDELRSVDHLSRSSRTKVKRIEEAIQKYASKNGRLPDDEELASEVDLVFTRSTCQ